MKIDKVNIGFQVDDRIHVISMTPDRARQMGIGLINEADVVDYRAPWRERIKDRWKPGGLRDRMNYLVGFSVGIAFYWYSIENWWLFGAQITLGAAAGGFRTWGDGNDEIDEMREKYHGEVVDDENGQLPWEVIR